MYLRLKTLITLITQSTKPSSTTDVLANSSMLKHIIVELKLKGQPSQYALGYIDLDSKGKTCFYTLYSSNEDLRRGTYYEMCSGVILYLAAAPEFERYKMEYYLVPDNFNLMLSTALDEYFA